MKKKAMFFTLIFVLVLLANFGSSQFTRPSPFSPASLGPSHHFKFDGNLNDSSGNNNHLYQSSYAFTSPYIVNALGPNKSASFGTYTYMGSKLVQVNCGRYAILVNRTANELSLDNFTLSLWFKVENSSRSNGILHIFGNKMTDNAISFGTYDNKVFVVINDGYTNVVLGNVSIRSGVWSHIAIQSSNQDKFNLYINGNMAATPLNILNISNSPSRIMFGLSGISFFECMRGQIDEFLFYNKSLDANQIKQIYNSQRTGFRFNQYSPIVTGF